MSEIRNNSRTEAFRPAATEVDAPTATGNSSAVDDLRSALASLLQTKLGMEEQKADAVSERLCTQKREGVSPQDVAKAVYRKLSAPESGADRVKLKFILHFSGPWPTGTRESRLDIRAEALWRYTSRGLDDAVESRGYRDLSFPDSYKEAFRGDVF